VGPLKGGVLYLGGERPLLVISAQNSQKGPLGQERGVNNEAMSPLPSFSWSRNNTRVPVSGTSKSAECGNLAVYTCAVQGIHQRTTRPGRREEHLL